METSRPAAAQIRPSLGTERSHRRDLGHGVVLLVPWGGLAWLWWRLLRADGGAGLILAGWVVAVCAAATLVVTLAWVAHNLRIARQRGQRRGLPTVELTYDHDWTGRTVQANWPDIRAASVVVIATGDGEKAFLVATTTNHRRAAEPVVSGGPGPTDRIEVAS